MLELFIFVTTMAVFFLSSFLQTLFVSNSRKKIANFLKRESVSLQEIYQQYYFRKNINKLDFEELWIEVANALCLQPEKLKPTDKFGQDIGVAKWDDSESLDLLDELAFARQKKIIGKNIDLPILTVDDYIMYFTSGIFNK